MADEDLKREPHHFAGNADAWWYEESGGISVMRRCDACGAISETFIRWTSLRAALKRKDKSDGT